MFSFEVLLFMLDVFPRQRALMTFFVNRIIAKKRSTLNCFRGTQRQFSENICSEDDLRSKIFGTFAVKFLACLPLLGFSNI